MRKGDTSHVDRVEPRRGLARQVKGFEEVEEHRLVNSAVHQVWRIGSDESTSTIFQSALWENDWERRFSLLIPLWYRIIVNEVLCDFLGSRSKRRFVGLGASEMSSSCASSRSHCSSSPSSSERSPCCSAPFFSHPVYSAPFCARALRRPVATVPQIVRVEQPRLFPAAFFSLRCWTLSAAMSEATKPRPPKPAVPPRPRLFMVRLISEKSM